MHDTASEIIAKIREKKLQKQLEENPLWDKNRPVKMKEEVKEEVKMEESDEILQQIRDRTIKRMEEDVVKQCTPVFGIPTHSHTVTMPGGSHTHEFGYTTVSAAGDSRIDELHAKLNHMQSTHEEDKHELKKEIIELRKQICLLQADIVEARNARFRDEYCVEVAPGITVAKKDGEIVAMDIEGDPEGAYARAMKVLD